MFRLLQKESWQNFWLILHVFIGFGSLQSKWVLIVWFWLLSASFLFTFFTKADIRKNIIFFLGYSLGIEVLARGVVVAPFIPDQLGKYLAVFLFGIGLLFGGPIKKISVYGVLMLVLSLPALTIAGSYTRNEIVFNYFGPLALFLGVIFCARQILTFDDLKKLIRIIIYPILSLACFTIYRASQFEKISYSVSANYDSGGGSITNQVATLFGTAICLMFLMYLTRQKLFKIPAIEIGLLFLFLFRGLLTFSRGGILSAVLAILVVIIFPKAKAAWQDSEISLRQISMKTVFFSLIFIAFTFFLVNAYTNNFLLYRYESKTANSIQTGFEQERDMDEMTSGRLTIFMSDIRMFIGNPLIGVGVGKSMGERPKYDGPKETLAHIEFSRLLAEHGFPGLIIAIMIYFYPFYMAYKEPNNYKKAVIVLVLIMGLSTTFHSAMRTMIAPYLFSLAFINYVPSNYDWRAHLSMKKRKRGVKMERKRPVELAV